MELSSTDILKKLPEFEDMLKIGDEISRLLLEKLVAERNIKIRESEIIKIAMTDPTYFVGGKQPSVSFIETAYMYSGLQGELIPLREELANILADLDKNRTRLDLYKEFLNVWRTLSASERSITA